MTKIMEIKERFRFVAVVGGIVVLACIEWRLAAAYAIGAFVASFKIRWEGA